MIPSNVLEAVLRDLESHGGLRWMSMRERIQLIVDRIVAGVVVAVIYLLMQRGCPTIVEHRFPQLGPNPDRIDRPAAQYLDCSRDPVRVGTCRHLGGSRSLMEIVTAPRRGGKTHMLVEYMHHNPYAIMIQPTEGIANMTRQQYPELADRIFGPDPERLIGLSSDHELYIDNAELLLHRFFGRMIDGCTFTGRSTHINTNPFIQPFDAPKA